MVQNQHPAARQDAFAHPENQASVAGANELEALTFSLGINPATGQEEVFGINVFKVKEVIQLPPITAAPHMPPAVRGMVNLRGSLAPVIDLCAYAGFAPADEGAVLIMTEYNRQTQGFLVKAVDSILRINWGEMKAPPAMIGAQMGGLVTAVTTLPDGKLALMLDVERVLGELNPPSDEDAMALSSIEKIQPEAADDIVFFCDDSCVARKQIQLTLDSCGIPYRFAENGRRAWEEIQAIVDARKTHGRGPDIKMILTDIEMPELDGYALTRLLKNDERTKAIPVVMHSSLSTNQNQAVGKSLGAELYLPKFKPDELAKVFMQFFPAARKGS